MKGPGGRLKHVVQRVWLCPACQRERQTGGHIVNLLCECGSLYDPPRPTWMQLIEGSGSPEGPPCELKEDSLTLTAEEVCTELAPETDKLLNEPTPLPRLVPDYEFPPYSYVSGQFPHPESDPAGHSFGKKKVLCDPLEANDWQQSQQYLIGLDLFNHGYYWEAHEAWESLWRAADRKSPVAQFLQGLIKLAAAAVKARERIPQGVQSHARRARDLFKQVTTDEETAVFMGLSVTRLIAFAERLEEAPILGDAPKGTAVEQVFPLLLVPEQH